MSRKFRNILIIGASGQLGKYLVSSGLFSNLLTPSHKALDLSRSSSIKKYFQTHSFDVIIHAAAIARMLQCQKSPVVALQTNLIGTSLLVEETLRKDKMRKTPIRFMYISTDGVYSSRQGHYNETGPAIPYNNYGWTKLGGECAVHLLKDFCIIRTRFFDPSRIPFKKYAIDSYSSNVPINELAKAICILLNSDFIGTVNVGGRRGSDYARYKKLKPSIQPCRLQDIQSKMPFILSRDASLNCSLWNKITDQSSHAF
jgi:dTDP-4-dehydrorhamnose reductase